MNILIDKQTKVAIEGQAMFLIEFGSGMRGELTPESDRDYLCIIPNSINWMSAPFNTHHLLQYKGDNSDTVYCTISTFIKSLMDGDSTIFHEIIEAGAHKGTQLEILEDYRSLFDGYRTIRAYLGISARDAKEVTKYFTSDSRKSHKKFKFSISGYKTAHRLATKIWPDISPLIDIPEYGNDIFECTKSCNLLRDAVAKLRAEVNEKNDADLANNVPICNEKLLTDLHRKIYEVFPVSNFMPGIEYFINDYSNPK